MNQDNNKEQSDSNLGRGAKSTKETSLKIPTSEETPQTEEPSHQIYQTHFLEKRIKEPRHVSEVIFDMFLQISKTM